VSIEEEQDHPPVDLKALKVNELGKIMILMYHDIGESEDVWVRTPENFRKDLQTLYDKGYRAISMKDYIKGNIDTPPGTTPVVITFDDGTKGQFNILDEDGEFVIDPNSAVGILEEFNKQHPDFGLKATFYVFYPTPFRQEQWVAEKFQYLVERGMEIGNHCYNHENLRMDFNTKESRDAQFIQEALGKNVKATQAILPGYEVDSLALPYGASPKDEELYNYVIEGSFEGTQYHNKAILLVGSNPARPSYHVDTNMARIPRIRASEIETENTGLYDWLEYFDKHPEERYISDGDPNTISFPKELEESLDKDKIGDKTIQVYE
ncbi:MAG: polysaccharide deacetylase family protein, partial [Clostridiales bacterium]|nr:polysaccharide deacetylase family protein [Clostridiales bacterium]